MRCVVQKVNESSVIVDGKVINKIGRGLMVLVGFTDTDTIDDLKYCVRKIVNLRIFEDDNDVMNRSVLDEHGEILSISQFTLYGDVPTKPGVFGADMKVSLINDGPTTIIIDTLNK